jgi:hypothetical protein
MRARYTGNAWGMWKGLSLSPGGEFDIPEALQEIVARHPQFELIEQRRGPGRPPKVRDGNES